MTIRGLNSRTPSSITPSISPPITSPIASRIASRSRAALRLLLVAGAALALLAVVAAPASAGTGRHSRVKVLATILTGENETAAGDADGIGVAVLRLRPATGQICYLIAVARLDTVVAAHIHRAPAGTNGPVIVPLTAPVSGFVKDCATADLLGRGNFGRFERPDADTLRVHFRT